MTVSFAAGYYEDTGITEYYTKGAEEKVWDRGYKESDRGFLESSFTDFSLSVTVQSHMVAGLTDNEQN